MFVKKQLFSVLALSVITACGGMETTEGEATLGISGNGGGGVAVEEAEVVMVDPFCGMIQYPSEDYTVGMEPNTWMYGWSLRRGRLGQRHFDRTKCIRLPLFRHWPLIVLGAVTRLTPRI